VVYPIGTQASSCIRHVINEFEKLCEILLPNMFAYIISYNIKLLRYLGTQKPTMILQLYMSVYIIYLLFLLLLLISVYCAAAVCGRTEISFETSNALLF